MDCYEIIAEDRTPPATPTAPLAPAPAGPVPCAPAAAAAPVWMVVQSGAFALIVDLG